MEIIISVLNLLLIVGAGLLLGKLATKVKMPAVLGYLIAGMIIGPFALDLISPILMDSYLFKIIAGISIGYVGYLVGAGIHIEELKESGLKIMVIGLFEVSIPFLFVSLVSYYLLGLDFWSSMILGSIALATAPALAIAITKNLKTDGPLTRTLMPIVAIDDIVAVLAFGFIIAFAGSHYSGTESSLIEPVLKIVLSLIIGLGFGLGGRLCINKFIDNKPLVVVLNSTLLLILMFLMVTFHGEAIMAGMAYGFLVVNSVAEDKVKRFSKYTDKLVGLAMVLFLVIIGATLDIHALFQFSVLIAAIIYVVTRATGKILGSYFGSAIMKAEPVVKKYLGVTLLSHAGISLAFAGIAASVVPEHYGLIITTTVAAAAIINEFIAVFATEWAFEKSGESGKAED